jgi:hypothetical protein
MRIAFGNMSQQLVFLYISGVGQQFNGDVTDKRKTFIVVGHQTGKWIFANDGSRMLGVIELFGQIHAAFASIEA